MKKTLSILTFILLMICTACKEHKHENSELITKTEVEQIVAAFNKIIVNPNEAALKTICSKNLTYGHSSGLIQNKAEFINDLVYGPYDFKSVTSPELSINSSGNTAIARFVFLATAIKGEETIDIKLGCIQVFQKQEHGELLLLARQAYKLPEH